LQFLILLICSANAKPSLRVVEVDAASFGGCRGVIENHHHD